MFTIGLVLFKLGKDYEQLVLNISQQLSYNEKAYTLSFLFETIIKEERRLNITKNPIKKEKEKEVYIVNKDEWTSVKRKVEKALKNLNKKLWKKQKGLWCPNYEIPGHSTS